METIMMVIDHLFTPYMLLIVLLGTILGVILGAIPGLGGGIGVSVMLPFTYAMDPAAGLLLLGGVFMGASYGGAISAILINVPGTAESFCTALEGHPMKVRGRAKEALYLAAISSVIGGTMGVLVLISFTPVLARVALKFGPPEMALVALVGLTVIASLSRKNLLKGLFGGGFGIFLGMVGMDMVTGAYRFNFGFPQLNMGITLIPLVLGFFALTEMYMQMFKLKESSKQQKEAAQADLGEGTVLGTLKLMFLRPFVLIKSVCIGIFTGVLPGPGAAMAAFIAYGEAKRTSKEEFGKGAPEGIVAAESANNAAVSGTLVPTLALGIPGSHTAALFYGALVMHGIVIGPRLFTDHAETAFTFVYGMLLVVLIMGLVGILCVPLFSTILKIRMEYIIPFIIACSFLGAYSTRSNVYDIYVMIALSLIGYAFIKLQIPLPPIILGLILGNIVESNLVMSLVITGAEGISFFQYIMTRPLSLAIILVGLLLIYANFRSEKPRKTKDRTPANNRA